ncbi:HAD-IA family hydrolase [Arthrobacter sp. LAPM80]|uniref:HAD family hydrolase n=1 Tax=Arthrobacter sp. LAPM80 TaxID=3141788 RepID=UPI00398A612C
MTTLNDLTTPTSATPTTGMSRSLRAVIGETFDAVLFDMDGTLIDSTPAVLRAWLTWGAEHGLDPAFLDGRHGHPARDIVASLVPAKEFQRSFERIQELEMAEISDITILPGATEALSAIGENRKAIVTSCTRPLAAIRIMASGLTTPRVIVTFDDVIHGKPHPEPFLLGAQWLGYEPANCLVIEDAPAGLHAAHNAGCTTLAVTGTHETADLNADLTITSLTEIQFTTTPAGIHITQKPHHTPKTKNNNPHKS